MKIGIGIPAYIPWVSAEILPRWAEQAEEASFSSLATIDRIAYGNLEPLVSLSVAAAVTKRIRLMTSVLLAPTRNAVILAKEAATLDRISGGRLTLGMGIGARQDDFKVSGAGFRTRSKRFEKQLDTMKAIWSGRSPVEGERGVGPLPGRKGGPEILIGAYTARAIERVGRWGDGFISGGLPAKPAAALYEIAREAWKRSSRTGEPRFVGCLYYALGPDAAQKGGRYLRDYYGHLGDQREDVVRGMISTKKGIEETIGSFKDAGADELVFWPCIPDLNQIQHLARAVPSPDHP